MTQKAIFFLIVLFNYTTIKSSHSFGTKKISEEEFNFILIDKLKKVLKKTSLQKNQQGTYQANPSNLIISAETQQEIKKTVTYNSYFDSGCWLLARLGSQPLNHELKKIHKNQIVETDLILENLSFKSIPSTLAASFEPAPSPKDCSLKIEGND